MPSKPQPFKIGRQRLIKVDTAVMTTPHIHHDSHANVSLERRDSQDTFPPSPWDELEHVDAHLESTQEPNPIRQETTPLNPPPATPIPPSTPLHSPQLAILDDAAYPPPPPLSNDHMDALGSLPPEYAVGGLEGTPPGSPIPFVPMPRQETWSIAYGNPPPSMQSTQTG
jgi:hypothetical protein